MKIEFTFSCGIILALLTFGINITHNVIESSITFFHTMCRKYRNIDPTTLFLKDNDFWHYYCYTCIKVSGLLGWDRGLYYLWTWKLNAINMILYSIEIQVCSLLMSRCNVRPFTDSFDWSLHAKYNYESIWRRSVH